MIRNFCQEAKSELELIIAQGDGSLVLSLQLAARLRAVIALLDQAIAATPPANAKPMEGEVR